MNHVGVIGTLLLGGSATAYYFLSRGSGELNDRIAAIDAAAGVQRADSDTLLRRLLAQGRGDALEQKLQQAGWYDVSPHAMFRRSAIALLVGVAIGVAFMIARHSASLIFIALTCVLGAYGAYWPFAKMHRTIDKRKRAVHRELPDFLDVLATTVDAGIALNGALAAAADALHGPLGEEMHAALQDIRLGRSRADALNALAQRVREPDLTTTMIAIVQSERLGASITDVLHQLAAETRERRTMRAEELAAQLPNKLVIPVGLCMLPSLLLLIFGAVVAKLVTNR